MVDGTAPRPTVRDPGADPSAGRRLDASRHCRNRVEVTIAVLTYLSAFAAKVRPESDEDGQGLAEYALILALIAIVAIIALIYLGSQISDKLSTIGNAM